MLITNLVEDSGTFYRNSMYVYQGKSILEAGGRVGDGAFVSHHPWAQEMG